MTAQTILPANTLSGGYNVANSCRFDRASSDDFTKTSSGGSKRKATFSAWLKWGIHVGTSTEQGIFESHDGTNYFSVYTDGKNLRANNTGGTGDAIYSTQVLRDPSAWYHVVIAVDSEQSTASNRFRMYINGSEVTSFSAAVYPTEDEDMKFNGSGTIQVGGGAAGNWDGYMAEVVWIDGLQLTPTSFGEFDEDSGIWKPIDVSDLTFGANGFYLDFKDSANLGNDANGGTDLGENNIVANNQSTDTCTNNFCTLNPLYNVDGSYTLSVGNTQFLGTGGNDHTLGTLGVQGSGKWYFEAEFDTNSSVCYAGFADVELANNEGTGNPITSFIGMYRDDHTMQIGGGNEGAYTDVSDGDIFGFAMNLDAASGSKTVIVQKNGSTIDTVTIPTANEDNIFIPIAGDTSGTDSILKMNFGGTPNPTPSSAVSDANGFGAFEYSPTIGGVAYLALCTKNLGSNG